MNRLTELQHDLALVLFRLPEATGYAMAGGAALIALGIVDRQTRDLDAFASARPTDPPGDVGPLTTALRHALMEVGWTVDIVRQQTTFTRLVVEHVGNTTEIDLAIDSPPMFPLEYVDGIPTLGTRDLAARKVLALVDRAEGRDFTDLWHLSHELGRHDFVRLAGDLDAGVDAEQVVRAIRHLERLTDDELPCDPAERDAIRRWFSEWSDEIGGGGS